MSDPVREDFFQSLGVLGAALLQALEGLEWAERRLHPPDIARLRRPLEPVHQRLEVARRELAEIDAPGGLDAVREDLLRASELASQAIRVFAEEGDAAAAVPRVLGAMRAHCRALETLYPLRVALPPVSRFFVEAPFREDVAALDPETPEGVTVGLQRGRAESDGRGGFSLYVPETYDGQTAWPLVVALHGGSGDGRDFLWTWLREARGRRFLLLAPTSRGPTWSLNGPDVDARALKAMVGAVSDRWNVDASRILLTGLSDGGTYALLCGLQPDMPFTALAPLSGVLHPMNFANGNLERAAGKRIYLVHGALDWMFPVAIARVARQELEKAGADLVYREIEDLSHTYARDENDRILSWFDPALALPGS